MGFAESDPTAQSIVAAFRAALAKLSWTDQQPIGVSVIKPGQLLGSATVILALSCVSALAQQVTGVPGSPGATPRSTENSFHRLIRNSAG